MKFYKFFIIGLIISLAIGINSVAAQNETPQSTSLLDCMKGWRQFLASVINYEGFAEYWDDIIRPNLCHKTDIEMIERQVRKARQQVKTFFMRCDLKNLDRVTKAYYKLEAELYFLRNAFSENIKADVISRIETEEDKEVLTNEMKKFFTFEKGFLTEELLRQYVNEFIAKYRARLDAYKTCRNDFYEELGAKWNELMQNFKDFGKNFEGESEEQKKRKQEREAALKEAGIDPNEPSPRKGPWVSADEDIDVNLTLARLKVSPEKSLEDMTATMAGEKQKGLAPSVPIYDVQALLEQEKTRVFEEKSQAEMEAYYQHLYSEMSDKATMELVTKIDELIETISTTAPFLAKIEECVRQTESKQCKNKK